MAFDLRGVIRQASVIKPAAARNAGATGVAVSRGGDETVVFLLDVGTVTDGSHTPVLKESDDNSTFTNVAAGDMDGSFAAMATNVLQTVAYQGKKEYVKVDVTQSGSTTGALYACQAVVGGLRKI